MLTKLILVLLLSLKTVTRNFRFYRVIIIECPFLNLIYSKILKRNLY